MSTRTPPRWCSDAVATKLGWADPKTGELLVANKHLANPIENYTKNRPILTEDFMTPLQKDLKVINEVLEEKEPEKPPVALKELPPQLDGEPEIEVKPKKARKPWSAERKAKQAAMMRERHAKARAEKEAAEKAAAESTPTEEEETVSMNSQQGKKLKEAFDEL